MLHQSQSIKSYPGNKFNIQGRFYYLISTKKLRYFHDFWPFYHSMLTRSQHYSFFIHKFLILYHFFHFILQRIFRSHSIPKPDLSYELISTLRWWDVISHVVTKACLINVLNMKRNHNQQSQLNKFAFGAITYIFITDLCSVNQWSHILLIMKQSFILCLDWIKQNPKKKFRKWMKSCKNRNEWVEGFVKGYLMSIRSI